MPEYRLVTEIAPGNRETQMVELPRPPQAGEVVMIDGRRWVVVGPHPTSVDQAWLCKPA